MIDGILTNKMVDILIFDNKLTIDYNTKINVRYVIPFREEVNAFLTKEDDTYHINIRHNLNWEEQFVAFCHELVHVEQMVRGDLIKTKNGVSYKGEQYSFKKDISLVEDYKELPWEREANIRQVPMSLRLIDKLTNDDLLILMAQ
ncbi:ImmA/IrrE family metallopeptidase [Ochrobactrum phage vB_OspM_OC]|nr:ImmA/IrrE family metallopeptidase [Ochrobactrum phage vB_OspM_OC]